MMSIKLNRLSLFKNGKNSFIWIKILFVNILFLTSLSTFAQSKTVSDGEKFFNQGEYEKALDVYKTLLKSKPKNQLLKYKCGRCCYELGYYEEAIAYFLESDTKTAMRNFYLANLYFDTYRFEESIESFDMYAETLAENDEKKLEIYKKLNQAHIGANFIKRVKDISIIDSITVDKRNFLSYYKINPEIGAVEQDQISQKGRKHDRVFYTPERRNKLYFSDDNQGQMDIFSSFKLLSGWSKSTLIEEGINSEANENYPFIMSDGVTIYFASDREGSLGGYDIFVSRYIPAENRYFNPENVGMPFNSPYNDYMMVIDEAANIGWFASDRYQKENKVMLYLFAVNESKELIKDQDDEYIRNVARLKSFRKSLKSVVVSFPRNNEEKIGNTMSPKGIELELPGKAISDVPLNFIINDTLIYSNVSEFKSQKSLQMLAEMRSLSNNLSKMQEDLDILREQYSIAGVETRSELAPQILNLETSINEHKQYIEDKKLQIRNEEIKQIILDSKQND